MVFWESGVSMAAVVMVTLWVGAFGIIATGWTLHMSSLGQMGLAISALAACLTIIRDNQRTRRMLRRSPLEVVAPMGGPRD